MVSPTHSDTPSLELRRWSSPAYLWISTPFFFFLFPCSLFTQTAALSCVCDFDWESIINWESIISLPLDLHSFLALLVVFLFSSIENVQEVNFNCRPGASTTLLVLLVIRRWQSRQSSTRWSDEMRFCHRIWLLSLWSPIKVHQHQHRHDEYVRW